MLKLSNPSQGTFNIQNLSACCWFLVVLCVCLFFNNLNLNAGLKSWQINAFFALTFFCHSIPVCLFL